MVQDKFKILIDKQKSKLLKTISDAGTVGYAL
jgi:hypothetical protein